MKYLQNFLNKQRIQNTLDEFMGQFYNNILDMILRVIFTLLFFAIGIWVIGVIRKILKKSLVKMNADLGVQQFLDSLFKVLLTIVLIFMLGCPWPGITRKFV